MSNIIRFNPNPFTDYLLQNWETIRDEYIAQRLNKFGINLLEVQQESNKLNGTTFHKKQPLFEGNIHAGALYAHREVLTPYEFKTLQWGDDEIERFWNDNIEQMPTVGAWLKEWFPHIASAVFYTAQPGSKINHHYGVDTQQNNVRIHLCLTDDPKCVFDIENERHVWKAGEIFGFDDCNYYHGIKHGGTNPRSVLVIDVEKSFMKPYAINWPDRKFIPHHLRTPVTIHN
jgi:hypothetical protein